MNRPREDFRHLNRLFGAFRLQHVIPVALQKNTRQFAQIGFVLRDQNRLAPSCRRFGGMQFMRPASRSFRRRQIDAERAAASRFTRYLNASTALLHNPVHRRQSEPRAYAHRLGGEKWLEDMGEHTSQLPTTQDRLW